MRRPELPRGTVTFLFTDIEGSTRLLHELGPEGYERALAEHRRALRETFARNDGVEVDTQGDAFFVAFPTARGAVEAAAEAQQMLLAGPIRVRMGLHTGAPFLGGEGYVGVEVNVGARIAAAGHGGQVLLSKATRGLLEAEVMDLGEHRLKDFAEPVWIFQLGTERFPPLKTISNSNLPRPASSFVGRARELGEVVSLLHDGDRVVTLHGPGGSGKTRLAGIADAPTLDYVARLLGDEEVRQVSSTSGAEGRRSTTESVAYRTLAPANVLREMRPGHGLLVYGHLAPARLALRPWFKERALQRQVAAVT